MASLSSAPPLDAAQRKFLTIEMIVNGVASALFSALFVWLMFRGAERIPLWGMNGLAFDIVPTTFMITLMMTLGLTLFTRWRCAKGMAPRCDGHSRMPGHVIVRALLLAVGLSLVLVPLTVGLLALLGPAEWSYRSVMLFKIVYGIALAVAITPTIVLAAMRDGNVRGTR